MEENLGKIEDFFRYDLSIKRILYNATPRDEYSYDKSSVYEYYEKLYEALSDIEFYLNKICDLYFDSERDYIKNFIKVVKLQLNNSKDDYEKLKKVYNMLFSNMREELVDKVGTNIVGYTFSSVSLSQGKSINEILHIAHKTITNNEHIYQGLPILFQKKNDEGYPITLYGKNIGVANTIYNHFPLDMSAGWTDIVSLNNNHMLIMVRDRGHALSIEIEKENDIYYIKYFIPKICNIDMVNSLPGVDKVDEKSQYTIGVFKSNEQNLPDSLYTFISKVPMDKDMPYMHNFSEDDHNKQI